MSRSQLLSGLVETIREFQLQNRFSVRAHDTALDLLGSRLLTDIDASPDIRASELSSRLALSPTVISRALTKLDRAGLVRITVATSDGRARALELTPAGRRELAAFDRQADSRLLDFQSNISAKEFSDLRQLLRRFAAGLNTPLLSRPKKEHALRPAIRAVTQALGLLHGGIFNTTVLGSPEWQTLSLIQRSPCPIAARDLAGQLAAPKNTISQLISRLEKLKYINRIQAKHDKRVIYLALTNAGGAALQQVQEAGSSLLENALKDFSTSELEALVHLLSVFVGGTHSIVFEGKRLRIVRVSMPDTLAALRSFCVIQAGIQQRSDRISSAFYSETATAYALFDGDALVACLEFQETNLDSQCEICHWFHKQGYDAPELKSEFLQKTARLCFNTSPMQQIRLTLTSEPDQHLTVGRFVKKLSAHVIQPEDV